jgi:SP family sugar:H+ symporter-like MFS transporter
VLSSTIGAHWGRRVGLGLCALTCILGSATQCGVVTFAGLLVGRVISRLGMGLAGNFVLTYWSEVAPAKLRGLIVLMFGFLTGVAQLIGVSINEGTAAWTTRWARTRFQS